MNNKKNQPKNSNENSNGFPHPFDPAALDDMAVESENSHNAPFSIPPLPGMDLDSWADGRISIFASLDAAMTNHMMQAVSALSELRRHAEEDARRVAHQLEEEQRSIQLEVDLLKQQRQHLQEDLNEIRRELNEERARKYALEKENNLMGGNTPSEHANLLRELANLSQQVQELSYQIQNQPQNFASATIEAAIKPPREKPRENGEKNTNTPPPSRSTKKNEPILDMSEMLELDLAAFSDAPTPRLKSNSRGKSSNGTTAQTNPRQKEPVANRRQSLETEQHIERLLAKRSRAIQEDQVLQADPPINETVEVEQPVPTPVEDVPQSDRTARRKNDKVAMAEIGAKLGLDVQTPPPDDAMRFAHGFTPPPEEGEFSKMALTLEELFNSTASSTPSGTNTQTDESPFIGDIGLDNAGGWQSSMPSPETDVIPSIPPISRPRSGAETLYPAYVLNPPPSGSSADDRGNILDDIETKITVSNLQGLSLLMMEKVVRGLGGVRHVTVTDFRKGELVMEVVHNKSLELDKVLPALPDLKLKLISRDDGLMFIQER